MNLSCFIAAGYVFDVRRFITNIKLEEKGRENSLCFHK